MADEQDTPEVCVTKDMKALQELMYHNQACPTSAVGLGLLGIARAIIYWVDFQRGVWKDTNKAARDLDVLQKRVDQVLAQKKEKEG